MLNKLINTSDINLKILNIGFSQQDSSWCWENINNPFSRLYLITQGEAYVQHHGGLKYHLTPGKLHLIPCFVFHDYFCPKWFEVYYIHFTSRIGAGMDLFTIQDYDYLVDSKSYEQALFQRLMEIIPDKALVNRKLNEVNRTMFESIEDTDSDTNSGDVIESEGILLQLLAPIIRTAHKFSDPTRVQTIQRFWGIFEYIDENLDKDISLEELAGNVYLNPTYFSNLFYKQMGIRPIEYLTRKRIEQAQLLLLSSDESVQRIAKAVGFKEPSYFSRVFKKRTGLSPLQYRRAGFR